MVNFRTLDLPPTADPAGQGDIVNIAPGHVPDKGAEPSETPSVLEETP